MSLTTRFPMSPAAEGSLTYPVGTVDKDTGEYYISQGAVSYDPADPSTYPTPLFGNGANSLSYKDALAYQKELFALQQEAAREQMQFQQGSAREAMQFEANQAALNRDFQREMSDTAYQRAVADLRKAGLNPVLAVGASASTPQGSSAQGFAQSGSKAGYDSENIPLSWLQQLNTSATKIKSSKIALAGSLIAAGLMYAGTKDTNAARILSSMIGAAARMK